MVLLLKVMKGYRGVSYVLLKEVCVVMLKVNGYEPERERDEGVLV